MALRVAVQMDPLENVGIVGDSTFALMLKAQELGHQLFHYLAGDLSYEEVAAHCQCPVGTVKSRVSRARLDLKRMLDEESMAQPRRNVPPVANADLTESLGDSTEMKIQTRRRSRAAEERVVN